MTEEHGKSEISSQFQLEILRQGPAVRKAYMASTVSHLCSNGFKRINILELGAWAGASTITWAQALRKSGVTGQVHCVDIWSPYFDLEANDSSLYAAMNEVAETGEIFRIFESNLRAAGVSDIVGWTRGTTKDVLPTIADQSYDIVFVDASHIYKEVLFDIREAKRIVADGGIICGDDLELFIDQVDVDAMNGFIERGIDFKLDPGTKTPYHPGVTRAIAETFDKVSMLEGFWAIQRHGEGWALVDLSTFDGEIPDHLKREQTEEIASVVTAECGYNIVRAQGQFIGCRQSLGPVDFTIPLSSLALRYSQDDFIMGRHYNDVLIAIYKNEISRLEIELAQTK
ncbi:class I SAM-dependent methyltransferase [Rhizobium sp. Leaf262]|uniref:class I SAM-dependent methyltransferase n=1 Tax=Rhizobium sp. Leaf262 TaxID=1736312 RepID=UPI0007144738|nr:class I SAM-dependent methyltransferase [Rhizobium sp. Leaf262]KQO79777.1 hypothetical protein ASF29_22265 [Rhizobium sp. Leaf262]